MQSVIITGGTGFIGRNLIPLLQKANYQITVLSRTPEKYKQDSFYKNINLINQLSQVDKADLVINLTGENLSNRRWSQKFKHKIQQSRIQTTRKLVDWMQQLEQKPQTFISGSAIGYYGARGDEVLNEGSKAGNEHEFQVRLCKNWEASAQKAVSLGIRSCIIRTGIVLGNQGALQQMLTPFKFGLGGKLGSGKQFFSWIHIQDQVNAIMHLVQQQHLTGVFNLTAPNPVTNQQLTKTLGKILKRPTFASMPSIALKIIMGEMADILLTGQRVIPDKLLGSGFNFHFSELDQALENLVI